MNRMGNSKEDKIVVRDPAEVRREQAARSTQWLADVQGLEENARRQADLLIKQGAQAQVINHNNEFAARVDLRMISGVNERFRQRVEELIREKLGDDVDLLVKLFDTVGPYAGASEVTDITLWASPKKP